jgi:hypothetical protein
MATAAEDETEVSEEERGDEEVHEGAVDGGVEGVGEAPQRGSHRVFHRRPQPAFLAFHQVHEEQCRSWWF